MTGFFNAVSASFILLVLMSIGYFMGHLGWMTEQEKKFVSKYVVNIAVPCNCIVGLLNNLNRDSLAEAGIMLVSCLMSIGLTLLLSMVVATLLKLPRERWGVFVAMAGLANALFIGIPVSTQLFGQASMPYVMVYYLANTTFLQSVGFLLIENSGRKGDSKITVGRVLKDVFSKPPIIAVLVTLVFLLADIMPPQPFMKFAQYISNSVSPLALIYCGFIIYELGLKNIRIMPGLPAMMVVRLVISPLLCMGMCAITGVSGLPSQVFIVESALPVVSQVPVMAGAYGADEKYAATGACLSTLGGFITIPILMLIMG